MHGSVRLALNSKLEYDIISEAVDFVRDFEGDMIQDLVRSLAEAEPSSENFEAILSDILDLRIRVVAADQITKTLATATIGQEIYFNGQVQAVVERGLEFMQDHIGNEITDPFYSEEFKHGVDEAGVAKLRQSVELSLRRVDAAERLLKLFRST